MSNVTPGPATLELGMTEADFSSKDLGAGGAISIFLSCASMTSGFLCPFASNHVHHRAVLISPSADHVLVAEMRLWPSSYVTDSPIEGVRRTLVRIFHATHAHWLTVPMHRRCAPATRYSPLRI
jgi:hypothetical protein